MIDQEEMKRGPSNEDEQEERFSPSGTFLFVMLMLVGYALYWAYIWFIVVVEQG